MENISKIVLQTNGKRIGYVLDVALSGLDKAGYYVVDEESEGEFLLKNENILCVSEKFLLVEDATKLEFISSKPASILMKEVLDEKCNSLGIIKKIEFKKAKCVKIITSFCEILPKYVKTIGDFVFVSYKRKKKAKTEISFPRADVDITVKTQSAPERVVLSSSFYIGKISEEDIVGFNNEKIIKKGEVVTKSVVEKAKKHNRLNQLFFALKR